MEKMYCFKMFTKSDNKLIFESENFKEYKIADYVDMYNNYFLKELCYYKIDEIGTIDYVKEWL